MTATTKIERFFLCEVRNISKNVRLPSQDISVDEKFVLYKGHLYFRQYIPKKRSRYGVKIFACCEAQTGYLWNFLMHSSAENHQTFGNDVTKGEHFSYSERVIIELVKDILGQGYRCRIFADNWFSSLKLASFLIENDTMYTGTLRENRVMLKLCTIGIRKTRFCRSEKVLIAKFSDKKFSGKKTVCLIDKSSEAKFDDVVKVRRRGEVFRMRKPSVIGSYNSNLSRISERNKSLFFFMYIAMARFFTLTVL